MRLIDADALKDRLKKLVRDGVNINYDIDGTIDRAVTITPERKTGRWMPVMNGRGGHCCNRCNGYAPSYMNGDEHLSDFCPYCGADMRGGQDE